MYKYDHGEEPTLKLLVTSLRGELAGTTSTIRIARGPESPKRNSVSKIRDHYAVLEITMILPRHTRYGSRGRIAIRPDILNRLRS